MGGEDSKPLFLTLISGVGTLGGVGWLAII